MAIYTSNLNLKKPDGSENINRSDLIYNYDIIDSGFAGHSAQISTSTYYDILSNWTFSLGGFNAGGYSTYAATNRVNAFGLVYCGVGTKFSVKDTSLQYILFFYDKSLSFIGTHTGSETTWGNADYTMTSNYYVRMLIRHSDSSVFAESDLSAVKSAFSIKYCLPSVKNTTDFESNQTMKTFFSSELSDTISKVLTHTQEKSFVFGCFTDLHTSSGNIKFNDTFNCLKSVHDAISLDALVGLGDFTGGTGTKAVNTQILRDCLTQMRKCSNTVLVARGNHDDLNSDANFSISELYSLLFRFNENIVVREGTNLYYYIDFPKSGIRIIVLDSNHTDASTLGSSNSSVGFSTDELTWFTNTALNTTSNVIVFSHIPPTAALQVPGSVTPVNGAAMVSALTNWQTTSKRVISWICGHCHCDLVDTTSTSFPIVLINCSSNMVATSYPVGAAVPSPRTYGSVNQEVFDVVVVKLATKEVKFIRFGAGIDYTVSFAG
jgi:hypothetical protein